MNSEIENFVFRKKNEIFEVFEQLHSIPELSMQEVKTSTFIETYLKKRDFTVTSGIANTGLVIYIRSNKPGPVLGLRVDIDALAHNIDGEIKAIHSCGHDAHTTMGIFTCIIAKELNVVKKGSLKIIFQPSEEREETSGARLMSKEGVADDIDMLIGIHLRPEIEAKKGQVISALRHGALNTIVADIIGKGTHAGRPHQGNNPIDAMASIINAINAVRVDPSIPSSAKLTYINADGANFSSVPEMGKIGVDLRAQTNEVMDELIDKVKTAIITGASTTGCTANVEIIPGLPAAVFSDDIIQVANQSIIDILGEKGLLGERNTTGADDFHEFVKANPKIKATYLGLGCDLKPGLHHPEMTFNKDSLLDGISVVLSMVEKVLG